MLCLRINLNISFFINDGLTNLKNLSENKILKYERKYKKNFLNLTKNHDEKNFNSCFKTIFIRYKQ